MDELTPFLQYGVLGFATVAIFYSFQVLQKEQTREESPRQEI